MIVLLIISIWINLHLFVKYIKEKNQRIYLQNLCRETSLKLKTIQAKLFVAEDSARKVINFCNQRKDKEWKPGY